MRTVYAKGFDTRGPFIDLRDDGRYPRFITYEGGELEWALDEPHTEYIQIIPLIPLYRAVHLVRYRPEFAACPVVGE
jgi:hypothetical protein